MASVMKVAFRRRLTSLIIDNHGDKSVYFYPSTSEPFKSLRFPGDCPAYAVSLLPKLDTLTKSLNPALVVGFTDATSLDSLPTLRFNENPEFVAFMHRIIGRYADTIDLSLRTRAKARGNGWLHLPDGRSPLTFSRTPDADDIFGSWLVQEGKLVPGSYQRMPSHRLVSNLGMFRLGRSMYDKLIEELNKLL